MSSEIAFTRLFGPEEYSPVPATKALPDWYKKTEEYIGGEKKIFQGKSPQTIKKCMPVFDAMTAGYILFTPVDLYIELNEKKESIFSWPSQNPIDFHPIEQAKHHPAHNGQMYPKWLNPYAIKTPKGYSCFFVPPFHNPNPFFTILPGFVDTDTYSAPVNFPFVLNNPLFEGLIPAGTPMAQVIPMKRDKWQMSLERESLRQEAYEVGDKLRSTWFNGYKLKFWHRKEYK